ncbi:MAG TPA: ATP-binding protein [Actinomycetota bacterium]|nr:ATP-binding protein [Actinomycetota bacterium]
MPERRFTGPELPSPLEDIRRSERTMVVVRWAGVVFAVVQVLSYEDPYPPGVEGAALLLAGSLAVANAFISFFALRPLGLQGARILSLVAIAVDLAVVSGFVWLYAFDQESALWAIVFVLPLEGAIRFGLPGALVAWALATVSYALREVWGSARYGYPFLWNSVSFRMGIGLLIALVAGFMARNLLRQRADLARALADLRRVDSLRARLVAALAHDVRNPLTTIRGTLHTLARDRGRLPDRTKDELIRSADRQAVRLERLSSELLDLARMEEGRLDLRVQETRLREVIDRGLSYADPERRFEVRVDPDLAVRVDPARLEQMVVNLATNALQHGRPPFEVTTDGGSEATVDVLFTDHGPGVPPSRRDGLFEPFHVDADGRSVGLGLAIVRALAEAHGGDLDYRPNEPEGACFRLRLPAAAPA